MKLEILRGKHAFLTGASGGVGQALAHELSSLGCNLTLSGRNLQKLKRLARELASDSTFVHISPANLEKSKAVEKVILQGNASAVPVNILINAAAVFPVAPIEKTTVQEFDECFAVNVRAPFLLCRGFLPQMVHQGWGRVVNIGSSSAFSGFKNTSIYCASKHALLGLTRSLFDEMRTRNVRVISVNPGSIQTPMGKKVKDQDYSTFMDPAEVARFICMAISMDHEMVMDEIRLNRIVIR